MTSRHDAPPSPFDKTAAAEEAGVGGTAAPPPLARNRHPSYHSRAGVGGRDRISSSKRKHLEEPTMDDGR